MGILFAINFVTISAVTGKLTVNKHWLSPSCGPSNLILRQLRQVVTNKQTLTWSAIEKFFSKKPELYLGDEQRPVC